MVVDVGARVAPWRCGHLMDDAGTLDGHAVSGRGDIGYAAVDYALLGHL